jgi:hypothetical protein
LLSVSLYKPRRKKMGEFEKGAFTLPGEAGYEELTLMMERYYLIRLQRPVMEFILQFVLSGIIMNGQQHIPECCSRHF